MLWEAESWAAEVEWRATSGRMPDHRKLNGGQPEAEWLATGAEYRDTGAECRTTGSRMVGFGKRKARNFGVCALLLFVLLPGPPCGREQSCLVRGCGRLPVLTAVDDCLCQPAGGPPGRTRAGGRLVELVLDEELDGLVFCHSEFVVEDCGVVVSLLCAEPEFSLV